MVRDRRAGGKSFVHREWAGGAAGSGDGAIIQGRQFSLYFK